MLNGLFGKWLGYSKDQIDELILMGLLHDCGKAMIPARILSAPRKLTLTEFEVIKTHTIYGNNLLESFPNSIRIAARAHHEKLGGKGYPDRLSGNGIPDQARITSIVDIYDAMVSQRAYKTASSPFKIFGLLNELKWTDLDPILADNFIKCMSHELLGRQVLLSDNRIGTICAYTADNCEFPCVLVGDKEVYTNKSVYCERLLSDFEK